MAKGERTDQLKLLASQVNDRQRDQDEARRIVDRWNAQLEQRRPPQFSPTLGCAINAGKPWLRLHCPGCHQVHEIDLRRIVRPREFPIAGLALTCESMCRRQTSPPKLLGLFALPEQVPRYKFRSSKHM
jgi:hypothetical protein